MTHTPGPWTIGKYAATSISGPNDRHVATTGGYQSNVDGLTVLAENEANARLIAAAPDLLEALEEVMAWIDNWYPPFCEDDEWPDTNAKTATALAKARRQS